jgi:hypothetical protein
VSNSRVNKNIPFIKVMSLLAFQFSFQEIDLFLNKGCESYTLACLAIYIKKYYLKAKEEELWKLKYYFTMQKIYPIFKKIL